LKIKNVENYKVSSPGKSGAVKVEFWFDPDDAVMLAELFLWRAKFIPVDVVITKSADFLSQENGDK
jgi:hypothetical protein